MIAWRNPGRPIILASQSARRKEILHLLGFSFDVCVPESIDESSFFVNDAPDDAVRRLAVAKAQSVAGRFPQAAVLGADTVVVRGGTVFGKPGSRAEAHAMLASLSGCVHRVITGVALVCGERGFVAAGAAETEVEFRAVSHEEIDEYLAGDEYCDKAGAYAIQGRAMAFVEGIRGCYYNVVGLPVSETIRIFTDFIRSQE